MRYKLEDLHVDTRRRTVHRGEVQIAMPDLSFDTLVKLVRSAPDAVSLEDFRRDVWRATHVSSDTIAQRIALLRKALNHDGSQPDYIRTVRGVGYAIAGEVSVNEAARRSLKSIWKPALVAGGSALAVAAGLFLFVNPESLPEQTQIAPGEQSTATLLVERARSQLRLHQSRETDRAISLLREALRAEPGHFAARMALSSALTTKTTKFGGGHAEEQEAEALARGLIAEEPGNSRAWSALAYALGSQGRMGESTAAYEYAFQLDPNNGMAMSSAAHNLLVRGELQQAYALELRAKKVGTNNKYAEIQIAQIFELIGHPSAAIWREQALQLNPNQVIVLCELARMHLRQGQPEAALEKLSRVEGADQSAPQILQLRGRAELALGRRDTARSLFEAAGEWGHKDLVALNASAGDRAVGNAFLEANSPATLAGDTWPGSHVHMAEVAAAIGADEKAIGYLAHAVGLGWRDIAWLEQSPFLGDVMASQPGQELVARIQRELALQRQLIEGML